MLSKAPRLHFKFKSSEATQTVVRESTAILFHAIGRANVQNYTMRVKATESIDLSVVNDLDDENVTFAISALCKCFEALMQRHATQVENYFLSYPESVQDKPEGRFRPRSRQIKLRSYEVIANIAKMNTTSP